MTGHHFHDGYDADVVSEARLLLLLGWHVRQGAPVPTGIDNLYKRGLPIRVMFEGVSNVYSWARRFAVGVRLSNTHCGSDECAETEVLRLFDRDMVFCASPRRRGALELAQPCETEVVASVGAHQ